MPKAKKFLITTATREITFYRSARKDERKGHCVGCDAESYFLDLNEAADACGTGAFLILNAIHGGRLHVFESDNGHLFICRNSLLNWIKN